MPEINFDSWVTITDNTTHQSVSRFWSESLSQYLLCISEVPDNIRTAYKRNKHNRDCNNEVLSSPVCRLFNLWDLLSNWEIHMLASIRQSFASVRAFACCPVIFYQADGFSSIYYNKYMYWLPELAGLQNFGGKCTVENMGYRLSTTD